MEREEGLKQLKTQLQRGVSQAERGLLEDGDAVFQELRQLVAESRPSRKKARRM
jgi:hypothetical protein